VGLIPTIYRYRAIIAARSKVPGAYAPERIAETFSGRTLVFCVTSGRSGSQTLGELFATLAEADARHEPKPRFETVMRLAQSERSLADEFLRYIKLPSIRRSPKPIYVETSHLFCKGFFDAAIALRLDLRLVFLSRADRAIARSLEKLGTVPGRTEWGLRYYISPEDPVFLRLTDWQDLTDYQLCYWHCLEIRARQAIYAATCRAREIPHAETSIEALNLEGEFERVIAELGLALGQEDRRRLEAKRGQAFNRREGSIASTEHDYELLERQVRERIVVDARTRRYGYDGGALADLILGGAPAAARHAGR
jgi:hypothetical protein